MKAPATLLVSSPDGTRQALVKEGGVLPAQSRIVFATTRPSQGEIVLDLVEDPSGLVARALFELPRGLPPNTWLAVEVAVGDDLRVRAEARENLRRLRIDAEFDDSERAAEHYWV